MAFEIAPGDVPTGFSTATCVVRPLTVDDVELDYQAVMASREQLRIWEQDTWPADDFDLDGNLADLRRHQDLHDEGSAFTYTVMNPSETECLGCIYLFSPEAKFLARSQVTALSADTWAATDAAVYHWVRTSLVGTGFDAELFGALSDWLDEHWPIDRSVFVTNEQLTHQLELIERTGMTRRFVIEEPNKPGRFLAFA